MKRGGGLVNPMTLFYVVFLIGVFNIVAYIHAQDWSSIVVFVLAGSLAYGVTAKRTISIGVAVIAASLFRATNFMAIEGMETKPKDKPSGRRSSAEEPSAAPPAKPTAAAATAAAVTESLANQKGAQSDLLSMFSSEGMSSQLGDLTRNQATLAQSIKALEPLMMQASSLMKNIDPTIMRDAMEKFTQVKDKKDK